MSADPGGTGRSRAVTGGKTPSGWDTFEIVAVIVVGYACFLYYNVVGHVSSLRGLDFGPLLAMPLDRAMPYLPALVWFYQLAYVVPAIALVLIARKLERDVPAFRRIILGFLVLLAVHFSLYLLFPTNAGANRMAAEATGDGLNGALVRYQYGLATAWCACPSLHVSACWFFYRVFARQFPRLQWAYLFWFVGMFLGTAGIKIHYAVDGIAGLALAEIAFRLVLLRMERAGACGWTWRSNARRATVYVVLVAVLFAGIPLLMWATGRAWPLYDFFPGR